MPIVVVERNSQRKIMLPDGAATFGAGGSGQVYAHPLDDKLAIKLYRPERRSSYALKIPAAIATPPAISKSSSFSFAWPLDVAMSPAGELIGFTMPAYPKSGWLSLEKIMQEQGAILAGFNQSYRTRLLIALNLASAFAPLHKRRHFMIDLKPLNLMVNRFNSHIGVIDCDGMSILGPDQKRYPAGLVTPGFVAPEYIGKPAPTVAGDDRQDVFALAVLIFMLLNRGRHPFSGIPATRRVAMPGSANEMVAARLYPYGLTAHADIKPAQGSIHEFLPQTLRTMFDRAFNDTIGARPKAAEWITELRASLKAHRFCLHNPNHGILMDRCGFCAIDGGGSSETLTTQTGAVKELPEKNNKENKVEPNHDLPTKIFLTIVIASLVYIILANFVYPMISGTSDKGGDDPQPQFESPLQGDQ